MRRFKSFLLILIALWLPLQAAAAVAMPFCRHALEQVAQTEASQPAAHCHEEVAAHEGTASTDLGCDNCEMCHLASAGYIPSATPSLLTSVANVFVAQQVSASPSFITTPPQDPPRRLN